MNYKKVRAKALLGLPLSLAEEYFFELCSDETDLKEYNKLKAKCSN